jgi:outer membrane protein assembly factor BamB
MNPNIPSQEVPQPIIQPQLQSIQTSPQAVQNKPSFKWSIIIVFSLILIFIISTGIFLFAKNIPSKHANQIVTENTPSITIMPNQVTGSTTILQRVNAQRTNVYTDNFVLSDPIINLVIKQAQDPSIAHNMDRHIVGNAVFADGQLVFANINSGVFSVNSTTGKVNWQKPFSSTNNYSPPTVADDVVFAGEDYGPIHAFKQTTGEELWKFMARKIHATVLGGFITVNAGINSSPLVANNKVYVTAGDNYLYALDEKTGKKIWDFTDNTELFNLSFYKNMIYAHDFAKNIYALDSNTGKLIWKTTGESISDNMNFSSYLVIANDKVYYPVQDNSLIARDASTGKFLWKVNLSTDRNANISDPSVTSNYAYLTDRLGNLYIVDAITGVKITSKSIGQYNLSAPIVLGNNIYFSSSEYFEAPNSDCSYYYLYLADGLNGSIKKQVKLDTGDKIKYSCQFEHAPILGQNSIYLVTNNQNIYSVKNR